jgi:hypothetical protein
LNSILNGLGSVVKPILNSVVDNVENFTSCAGIQFTGAMINDIISKVSGGLQSAISGVSNILKFFTNFSVDNFLRSAAEGLAGLPSLLNCGESSSNSSSKVNQWIIGKGPKNNPDIPFTSILESANIAKSIATGSNPLEGFDIFTSATKNPNILNGCYTGPPTSCSPPKINIFGSNGSGASAIPLFGAISSISNTLTGSIIGIKVTNPGSGYDFPPFVEIVDNCNQGYGCIARSIINDKGQLESIYIVSEGENYPISTVEPYVVTDVIIQDPGQNYNSRDTATDNLGNEYKIEVVDGYINKIQPINTIDITDLPIIEIKSTTGSGAILKPILDVRPTFQGEVKQVIDCVT